MKEIKLGEVLDVKRGTSLSGKFYENSGKYIRLTLGNFTYPECGWKDNTSKDDLYYSGDFKNEYLLKKDDIITPLTEQVRGLLGNTARIPESDLYIQSGDIGKIIPFEKLLDKNFAYYLVSSPIVKKQLDAASQQTKIRHTSPDAIKNCIAFIPELASQKKIANLLDSLNKKISTNNCIISELESLAKTIYDYWFLQFEFPNEDGKPYKSSGGKMVWNEELKREIPEGWGVQTVNDSNIYVSDFTANGSFKGLADNVKYNAGEKYALLIRIVDFNNNFDNHDFIYVDKHAYDYLSKSHLLPNDIIICNVGAVGSVYRCPDIEIPMTLGPNGIVVKSSKGLMDNYLYLYFKYGIGYRQLLSISSGSIQMKFNKTNFRELPLLLPPTDINEKFNHIISSIFSMKNNSWKENKKLASLRDFLLPMLMNGQVTFKD